MGKTELRIEIDDDLLKRARAAGVEVAPLVEEALKAMLPEAADAPAGFLASALRQKLDPTGAEERARLWTEENADAIRAYNARIERRGVFGEDLRRW